ncbi:MAG: MotA/TolQ/ExbB proton channel family protein [Flavobacteriales bacterium]|nr:MotA/TolQ/ExbB proton channel family protein [Flavobacteriales bacterium]
MGKNIQGWLAAIIIPLAIVIAYFIYTQVLGNPANFEGGSNLNEPLKNNYLGVVYKGGSIVILLISFQIILVAYAIERFISLRQARGKADNARFVSQVKESFEQKETEGIVKACDTQQGSLASVIKNGIKTYMMVDDDPDFDKESKLITIRNQFEESTQLEIPQLNKNMSIIATLASISTLIGLLGTVTGMIKAFSALARVGAPDAVGLANGISQALVTTALGISTAAVAIVVFNYFTARIDKITFAIDEASFSILSSMKEGYMRKSA